jgi:ubiquinone/menaquinone biosynthesis C-methylase UbiE
LIGIAGLLSGRKDSRQGQSHRAGPRTPRLGVSTRRSPQSFDHFAERYDRRDELTGGFITEWLHGVLAGRGGKSALDLGCGSGRVAAALAERYDQVRAVDLSQSMIELARRRYDNPRITFEQGDLTAVAGQYDLVVSFMALHHVPELPATLARISQLVAPGGLAILVDAAQTPPRGRWEVLYWNLKGLAHDLSQAFEKFWLTSDPKWMDHLVSDRWLSPQEFTTTYQAAFPGAEIGPESGVYTAMWERPENMGNFP